MYRHHTDIIQISYRHHNYKTTAWQRGTQRYNRQCIPSCPYTWFSAQRPTSYWHNVCRSDVNLTSDRRTWPQYDVVLILHHKNMTCANLRAEREQISEQVFNHTIKITSILSRKEEEKFKKKRLLNTPWRFNHDNLSYYLNSSEVRYKSEHD